MKAEIATDAHTMTVYNQKILFPPALASNPAAASMTPCSLMAPIIINKPSSSPIVSKSCANFFTTDGQHYSSLSNGIIRAVKNLFKCGLAPTPETPIRIKFKNVNTPRGVAHSFGLVK